MEPKPRMLISPVLIAHVERGGAQYRIILTDQLVTDKAGNPKPVVVAEVSSTDAMGDRKWVPAFGVSTARELLLQHAASVIGGDFADAVRVMMESDAQTAMAVLDAFKPQAP